MMHLEAIIERNKRPARQPDELERELHAAMAEDARYAARFNKRPTDRPDPLPEAEAHPHLAEVDTTKNVSGT